MYRYLTIILKLKYATCFMGWKKLQLEEYLFFSFLFLKNFYCYSITVSICSLDSYCVFKLGERIVQLLSQMIWQPESNRARNGGTQKKKPKHMLLTLIHQQSNCCNTRWIVFQSRKIRIIIWEAKYFSFSCFWANYF